MHSATRLLLLCVAAASVHAAPVAQASEGTACNNDGDIICGPGGTTFFRCNFGKLILMGHVAAGTTCQDGKVIGSVENFPVMTPPSNQSTTLPSNQTIVPAPIPVPDTDIPAPIELDDPNPPTSVSIAPLDNVLPAITMTVTATEEQRVQQTSVVLVTAGGEGQTVAPPAPTTQTSSGGVQISANVVLAVAPSSGSCPAGSEAQCGTADVAAPFISQAFAKYNINTVGEAAAILSLMAFESGDFKFNTNQFPGRPGQGTKAMLMPNFIVSYAQSFESTDDIQAGLTPASMETASDDVKNKVLARVLSNDRTYGSAAWFYSENCSEEIKAGLRAGPSEAAWSAYITSCVFTTVTSDRKVSFDKAVAALSG